MPLQRQKISARVGLVAFTVLCGVWLARLDYGQKISTNVLDLIPASEQSPEVNLVRGFADDVQSRVMLFALRDPQNPGSAKEAATRFAAKLSSSPEFAEAVVIGDTAMQDTLGRAVFE